MYAAASVLLVLQVSGQAKIDSFKALLSHCGVPGPYRLQVLTMPQEQYPTYMGSIVLSVPNGDRYTCYFRKGSDRPYSVFRGREGEVRPLFKTSPLADKNLAQKVLGWANYFQGRNQLRLETMVGSSSNLGRATFRILQNGYPFVGVGTEYGFDFTFTVPEGNFLAMTSTEDPPPVDERKPKLDQAAAMMKFREIFDGDFAPRMKAEHGWTMSYKLGKSPTLGYFKGGSDKIAHLVWDFQYWEVRDVGDARQGGRQEMIIDAISGAQVPNSTMRG